MTVTLNCPPDNKLTVETFVGLGEAVRDFSISDVDLLIVTGCEGVFSKGFDTGVMRLCGDRDELRTSLRLTNAVFSELAACEKPVIAAINGHCLGGGLELALACHFRLCVEKVRLGMPEVWSDMVPGLGGVHRLTRLVGRSKALGMLVVGDLVASDAALAMGLVNRVFSRAAFEDGVRSFAGALLDADQGVIRALIRMTSLVDSNDEDSNVEMAVESFASLAPWLDGPVDE